VILKPKFNLWLEVDGQVALSLWRTRLLSAIAETGSISQGATQLNVPYRVAWQKIHEMETLLGEKLLTTQVGGPGGGGAKLTPTAVEYIAKFDRFAQTVQPILLTSFEEIFGVISV
jgi:molybdate transport repressor ModE-like protein